MLAESEKRIDDAQAERDKAEAEYNAWLERCQQAKTSGDKVAFKEARDELDWAGEIVQKAETAYQRVMAEVGAEVKQAKEILLAQHRKAADVDTLKADVLDLAKQAASHEAEVRRLRREALSYVHIARSRAELARDVARELKVTAIVPTLDDDDVAVLFDTATARFADHHEVEKAAE